MFDIDGRTYFGFVLSFLKLRFNPVFGRITLYARITLMGRSYWIQRWDYARCKQHHVIAIEPNGLMAWTVGTR